jgi:hypothetical protein
VELTVTDADGTPAGTARGQLREDGSLLFKLECAPGAERPVLTLRARGELIRTWTSRPLVCVTCSVYACVPALTVRVLISRSCRRLTLPARSCLGLAARPSCLASLAAHTTCSA